MRYKTKHKIKRLGWVFSFLICSAVLTIIEFPFSVKYDAVDMYFGEYQVHSIIFLGSPIHSWTTWNAELGKMELFIAFVLNGLVCLVILYLINVVKK